MIELRFCRYALGACVAAAMLAGCGGGSATPLSPSRAGIRPERTRAIVKYRVLYFFKGQADDDGASPEAPLLNVKGTLYGTTAKGGTGRIGAVFAITTSGAETVLHSFGGSGDGVYPYAGLVNVKGTLCGTTSQGGTNNEGTVFALSPSGTETVLYSFGGPGSGDGQFPSAGLTNVNGTLYGTTEGGGAARSGTVFAITTSGTEKVLYSFSYERSGDGSGPVASLTNVNGTLYGTTASGGEDGVGTVFAITTSGAETVLHSFGGSGDGAVPAANLINVNGTLYGTTVLGGTSNYGTVFSITTSGNEAVLHSFKGRSADGAHPRASLLNFNGTLVGTTAGKGAGDDGTVFAIRTSGGKETALQV